MKKIKIILEDNGQYLKSLELITMLAKDRASIESTEPSWLEEIYKGKVVDMSTVKVNDNLGIIDYNTENMEYLKWPISKIIAQTRKQNYHK